MKAGDITRAIYLLDRNDRQIVFLEAKNILLFVAVYSVFSAPLFNFARIGSFGFDNVFALSVHCLMLTNLLVAFLAIYPSNFPKEKGSIQLYYGGFLSPRQIYTATSHTIESKLDDETFFAGVVEQITITSRICKKKERMFRLGASLFAVNIFTYFLILVLT